MGKKEALDALRPQLTEAISRWREVVREEDWNALDIWVGENIDGIMADAALNVLAGLVDASEVMDREGVLNNGQ